MERMHENNCASVHSTGVRRRESAIVRNFATEEVAAALKLDGTDIVVATAMLAAMHAIGLLPDAMRQAIQKEAPGLWHLIIEAGKEGELLL